MSEINNGSTNGKVIAFAMSSLNLHTSFDHKLKVKGKREWGLVFEWFKVEVIKQICVSDKLCLSRHWKM